MNNHSPRAVIASISSDFGLAMAQRWLKQGWQLCGTYRNSSPALESLQEQGVELVRCDLSDVSSTQKACKQLRSMPGLWDALVLCPGTQEPVGLFSETDFDEWESSIRVNFTGQMRIVRELLPSRNTAAEQGPCVLSFAGGGTNNAPSHYSAYIVSKIALIKMTELLDSEVPDTRFAIVGPGWVKTKIHEATLQAGGKAGNNLERTKEKLSGSECTPMDDVLDCCDWLLKAPREIMSGRNFSVVFDAWGDEYLDQKLRTDRDMYKLRRWGNDFLIRGEA